MGFSILFHKRTFIDYKSLLKKNLVIKPKVKFDHVSFDWLVQPINHNLNNDKIYRVESHNFLISKVG